MAPVNRLGQGSLLWIQRAGVEEARGKLWQQAHGAAEY